MKILLVVTLCLLSFQSMFAQPPGGRGGPIGRGGGPGGPMGGPGAPGGGPGGRGAGSPDDAVARLMAFDKNSDAKLTSDELNDTRLQSLLTRADRDGDKAVTKQELITLFEAESKAQAGGPGDSGPGGFGPPPGGFGAGEPGGGGPGGFGPSGPGERGPRDVGQRGPRDVRRPGQVLPEPIVQQLQLSKTQVDELAKLQAMVDERLASILTSEQQSQLKEISSVPNRGGRGEGGPGGFGGRSGQ